MKAKVLWTLGAVIATLASYGTWAAIRAHRDLVTLNVRDMEVRRVVKKIEGQTWERIYVYRDVQGKVTLNVRKVPLEEVLRIIGEQTSARFSKMYPLYSHRRSLTALEKALRGELEPALHGWTNLQARGGFPGGGPGGPGGPRFGGGPGGPMMFGLPGVQTNQLVSLQIRGKDLQFASTALGRFGQARVIPEDKAGGTVNLSLHDATVSDAVAQLAKQARLKWAKIYQVRGDAFSMAGRGPDRDGSERRGPDRADLTAEERDARRKEREAREAELRAALPPGQQTQAEQARLEREAMFEQMRNMTPEQRRERFAQMGGAMREQRNLDRIKNTTPEQRVERYRMMEERRQRGEGRPR